MPALVLAVVAVLAAGAPIPPAPSRWVEDHAGLLSPSMRNALDARLEGYERATGHQVVVWIGTTIDGAALDDWAVHTFAAWKVGRKSLDDGLAMLVLADDRKIDIEVGYGLEARVPDVVASRIIREVIAPRLRAGDRDGAISAGVDAVLASIEGPPHQRDPLLAVECVQDQRRPPRSVLPSRCRVAPDVAAIDLDRQGLPRAMVGRRRGQRYTHDLRRGSRERVEECLRAVRVLPAQRAGRRLGRRRDQVGSRAVERLVTAHAPGRLGLELPAEHGARPGPGRAILDQAGRRDHALAQDAQGRAEVALAAVQRERVGGQAWRMPVPVDAVDVGHA
jgi:uncharacterized membrane protein YgcG